MRAQVWAIGLSIACWLGWGIGWVVEPVVQNRELLTRVRNDAQGLSDVFFAVFAAITLASWLKAADKLPFDRFVPKTNRDDGSSGHHLGS